MKIVLIVAALLLLLILLSRLYSYLKLDRELQKRLANGAIILDVRTDSEYSRGHIEGSINISLSALRKRYHELDPEKTYITCCSHGLRSIKAESLLKERGLENVYNGGKWKDLRKMV